MSKSYKNLIDAPVIDSLILEEILKKIVNTKTINKNKEVKKNSTGKLMWKNREVVARNTRVNKFGDLVTEITYEIPMEFEKENPGPIQMSKIITAVESLLDGSYKNFLNINKCKVVCEKEKYFVTLSATYTDYGPMRKDEKAKNESEFNRHTIMESEVDRGH